MQHCGLNAASSMARSSSGLYATTRSISMPHDAVRIALGRASVIRLASSGEANPPNTTEWIAPIRAHASMAMTVSGTMGI